MYNILNNLQLDVCSVSHRSFLKIHVKRMLLSAHAHLSVTLVRSIWYFVLKWYHSHRIEAERTKTHNVIIISRVSLKLCIYISMQRHANEIELL